MKYELVLNEIGNDWTFGALMKLDEEDVVALQEQLAVINGGLRAMNSGGTVVLRAME